MKSTALLLALLASALAAQAQGIDDKSKSSRTGISYGGGGIRGNLETVADGVLITPAEAREFQGEAGYNQPPPLRPRALVPGIEVLQPTPGPELKLKTPFAISVQFRAQADAPIVPTTFRVLYGALKLDITERITKFVTVTPQGFTFDRAQIPPGKHKLTLQVQDEKQRVAERELRFEVEP